VSGLYSIVGPKPIGLSFWFKWCHNMLYIMDSLKKDFPRNPQQLVSKLLVRVGTMAKEGNIGIEKFNGTDFEYWKMQIEDYLCGKKLHPPLLGEKPDNMKANEWALLDRQVLGVVQLTLSKSIVYNVVKEKTTTGLMMALSSMYENPSLNNKVHLMKKFNLKMAEGTMIRSI